MHFISLCSSGPKPRWRKDNFLSEQIGCSGSPRGWHVHGQYDDKEEVDDGYDNDNNISSSTNNITYNDYSNNDNDNIIMSMMITFVW